MKYDGEELIEITSEKWDGKTRQMLVWNGNDSCHLAYVVGYKHTHTTKHGFIEYDVEWLSTDGYYWQHCADIPNNESNEKFSIDYIIKTLTERTQDEYWMPFDNCIVEYLKELKELKVENEKLKEQVNYKYEHKQPKEDKPNLKVGKWYYCYKDLRIPNAVRSCFVPVAIEGNFVFDGKFFVVPNASLIVDDDYVTYDLNTTIKYEASTFDKIEELREKKPHKINDSWVGEWLSNTCVDKDTCNESMIKE